MRASVFPASIITLLLPVSAFALGIQVMINGKAVTFMDVPQTAWFATHVQTAAEAGIVTGYKDDKGEPTGLYGPGNSITLAEALKIASEAAGYDEAVYGTRVNSGVNHWASPYVAVAKTEKFEVTDENLNLNTPATRGEVAALITSAFRVSTDTELGSRYTDVTTSTAYNTSIEVLSRDDIITGDTDIEGQALGTFRPYEKINRAEVAKIAMNARVKYGTPGTGREPPPDTGYQVLEPNVVIYNDKGFTPSFITIKKGQAVTFRNEGTSEMWVASDKHPTHTQLPGFDAAQGLGQGETYVYMFSKAGTWSYHNHLDASDVGSVKVEE